jgi:cation transport protein ChaC
MWVFGYGSLMWDQWKKEYDGNRYDCAVLNNYHRSFNKKSVVNWGTQSKPCPTLGLEEKVGATCIGTAFEFDEKNRDKILTLLKKREGRSFVLKELEIILPDRRKVSAYTPVNDTTKNTYIGGLPINERISMAKLTQGENGSCVEYITNIRNKLNNLNIKDLCVEEFYSLLVKTNDE